MRISHCTPSPLAANVLIDSGEWALPYALNLGSGPVGAPPRRISMKTIKLCLLAAAAALATTAAQAQQQTLTIGFTSSQTGALNNDSTSQMRGFELWRDEVNAAGGIKAGGKAYKIEFKSYD